MSQEQKKGRDRPWLYFMVFIIFCNTMNTCGNEKDIIEKINKIEKRIEVIEKSN
jgi:hypothetical protein